MPKNESQSLDFARKLSIERPYMNAKTRELLTERGGDAAFRHMQFESDRGRIIQSAAIRRLQQKTQVYPLEKNAAVRSRLTHSMEVMQTGRHIVQTIFRRLGARAEEFGLAGQERTLETLVEMACLLHDVGNPPFGHFGEAAISDWFETCLPLLPAFAADYDDAELVQLKQQLMQDAAIFEGNAQAVRLTHSLLRLNLTYAQAASILKYTRCASEARPEQGEPGRYLKKKPGYYLSEQAHVQRLQEILDIRPGQRHPLVYIMEAADDISYCLADIEDGVEKELMSYPVLAQHLIAAYDNGSGAADQVEFPPQYPKNSFRQIVEYALKRADTETINKAHEFFIWLRVGLIHPLVEHAAQSFIDHLEPIYHGNLDRAILEDQSPCHRVIETFKAVAFEHFFTHAEVETLELQGHHILTQLLNHYRPLLLLDSERFADLQKGESKGMLLQMLLFKRLPNKHVRAYQEALESLKVSDDALKLWEAYYRCRLIQDMVSSMTDHYALDEYRSLSALA